MVFVVLRDKDGMAACGGGAPGHIVEHGVTGLGQHGGGEEHDAAGKVLHRMQQALGGIAQRDDAAVFFQGEHTRRPGAKDGLVVSENDLVQHRPPQARSDNHMTV